MFPKPATSIIYFEILCWVDFPNCFWHVLIKTFGNFHWWIIRFPHAAAIFGILSIFRQTRNLQAVDDRENQNHVSMLSYYILIYLNIWAIWLRKETNRKWWIWGPRGKTKNQFEKTKTANPGFPNEFLPALVPSSSVPQRWGEISGDWCRKNISYPRICFRLQKKQ